MCLVAGDERQTRAEHVLPAFAGLCRPSGAGPCRIERLDDTTRDKSIVCLILGCLFIVVYIEQVGLG